ncbi:MAG: DegT/DnrJ/EryC1/StrS family aminotransferase [Elusimicrobiota bacterium]
MSLKNHIPFLDLKLIDSQIRGEIDVVYKNLIDNLSFIGGPEVENFGIEFGQFCGGGFCSPVANGTDALILALRALGVGPGDEVITVPFTFIATAEAIGNVGASIKFVDVDSQTFNLDPNLLEQAITSKTKAILPVHLYGLPADMGPIMKIAKKHNLFVIEDACQAHGATYKGKKVGILGDVACFSFYPTKNLGGFGDGGAVVSSNENLIKKVTQLANHGRSQQYFHEVEGLNSRMDSLQAAVLRIKLKQLNRWNDERRQISAIYDQYLIDHPFIKAPFIPEGFESVYHLYTVRTEKRDSLMTLLKSHNIGCGVYYPLPLHLQPAYSKLKLGKGSYSVSEKLSETVLSLPMFPGLTHEAAHQIGKILKSFSDSQ